MAHSNSLLGCLLIATLRTSALAVCYGPDYPSMKLHDEVHIHVREGQAMSNRRIDLVYFLVLVLVVGVGYLAANHAPEETEVVVLPDFSLPVIDLEIPFELPFELPYRFARYARPAPPKLALSENMESVMIEVRSVLLEGSEPVEVIEEAQFAAILE